MTKVVMLALFVTLSLVGIPAYGDLKCGDPPEPFGQGGLVVTWVGPVPKEAKVTFTNGDIFSAAARATGPEIPEYFPKKYTKDLKEVEIFNAGMFWDNQELARWQKRYNVEMKGEPVSIFEDYIKTGYVIFGALVEHPNVPNPSQWGAEDACSVVLQRGVIVSDPDRETLFIRSYFHNTKDSENFVNFVPSGGIKVSFASHASPAIIWFPLELTRVIQEPASYVVLDILTPKPLDAGQLPKPFRLEKSGQMEYQGKTYNVARVTAELAAKEKWPDLKLKLDVRY